MLENKIWICRELSHPCTITFKRWLFVARKKMLAVVFECQKFHHYRHEGDSTEWLWTTGNNNNETPMKYSITIAENVT